MHNVIIVEELRQDMTYPVGSNMQNAIKYCDVFSRELIKLNEDLKHKEIHLFCRGSSGAIISALVAQRISSFYKVKIKHVKKNGESSHNDVYSVFIEALNVIIDDFIASGATVNAIHKKITDITGGCWPQVLCVSGVVDTLRLKHSDILNIDHIICGKYVE